MEEIPHMIHKMPRRRPADGTFELTVRCNLHCKMCLFRHDDSENQRIMEEELTAEQWGDMARQAAEAGTGSVLVTGGEPLLRNDFCEIWERIYRQGFITTLYTNATLVTPKIMNTLAKFPPHRIGVTLYGSNSEVYEAVCGSGQAFYQAVEGVHRLLTLPSLIEFRTTIIKDNYHDADALENFIHKEFGPEYSLTQTRIVTKAVRGGCADVSGCRLEPEDNVRLAFRRGINWIKKYAGNAYNEKNIRLEWKKRKVRESTAPYLSLLGCNAGMKEYTIAWDGKMLACQMLGVFAADALNEGFQNAWNRLPSVIQLTKTNQACMDCVSRDLCNCCAASRLAETGDINGRPEYICRDTAVIQQLLDEGGIEYAGDL